MATVSLKTIRAAAAQLKSYVADADRNGDGVLTAKEVKAPGYTSGARYPFSKAALSMFAATAKGGATAKVADVKKMIDATVKDIGAKDFDKDGFIEKGREVNALQASKRLDALYAFAPKTAVEGYGGYHKGERISELLEHTYPGRTQTAFTSAASLPSSLKAYVLKATGEATVEKAFARAGGKIDVRKFRDTRTDELHTLVSWNNDSEGALFANRRKERTATLQGEFIRPD